MHLHLIAITTAGVLAYSAIHAVDPEQIAEALGQGSWIPTFAISQLRGLLPEPTSVPNRPIQPRYLTPTSSVPRYDPGVRIPVSYVVIPPDHSVTATSTTPRQPPHPSTASLPHKGVETNGSASTMAAESTEKSRR